MSKRIFLVLLAVLMLFAYGCSKEEPTETADAESTSTEDSISPRDFMVKIDWNDAVGAYVREDEKVTLTLSDASDDINTYYDVEFVDNENELTLITLENCGNFSEDGVLRVDVSESDTIFLAVIKNDDRDVDSIVVSGTYEGKDFAGNGTYFIAAG